MLVKSSAESIELAFNTAEYCCKKLFKSEEGGRYNKWYCYGVEFGQDYAWFKVEHTDYSVRLSFEFMDTGFVYVDGYFTNGSSYDKKTITSWRFDNESEDIAADKVKDVLDRFFDEGINILRGEEVVNSSHYIKSWNYDFYGDSGKAYGNLNLDFEVLNVGGKDIPPTTNFYQDIYKKHYMTEEYTKNIYSDDEIESRLHSGELIKMIGINGILKRLYNNCGIALDANSNNNIDQMEYSVNGNQLDITVYPKNNGSLNSGWWDSYSVKHAMCADEQVPIIVDDNTKTAMTVTMTILGLDSLIGSSRRPIKSSDAKDTSSFTVDNVAEYLRFPLEEMITECWESLGFDPKKDAAGDADEFMNILDILAKYVVKHGKEWHGLNSSRRPIKSGRRQEVSNKDFINKLKSMKSKGWSTSVVGYYENDLDTDEQRLYVSGGEYTFTNNNDERRKLSRQIMALNGGEGIGYKKGNFEDVINSSRRPVKSSAQSDYDKGADYAEEQYQKYVEGGIDAEDIAAPADCSNDFFNGFNDKILEYKISSSRKPVKSSVAPDGLTFESKDNSELFKGYTLVEYKVTDENILNKIKEVCEHNDDELQLGNVFIQVMYDDSNTFVAGMVVDTESSTWDLSSEECIEIFGPSIKTFSDPSVGKHAVDEFTDYDVDPETVKSSRKPIKSANRTWVAGKTENNNKLFYCTDGKFYAEEDYSRPGIKIFKDKDSAEKIAKRSKSGFVQVLDDYDD